MKKTAKKTAAYQFVTYNDWITFEYGKTTIVINENGVDHVTSRGKTYIGQRAADFVHAHPAMEKEFVKWAVARNDAVIKWINETPHYQFDCDGGALAVRVNGTATIKVGCGGDGSHSVYVYKCEGRGVPPFFRSLDISLDACTIEPLAYDYDGDPLCKVECNGAWFYRNGNAILINIW